MTVISSPRAEDMFRLSPDALDRLRGHVLAARDAWCAQLAEYDAMLVNASSDAFGSEVRQLAKSSISHIRDAIDDIDHTLERLVQTYGSCEWCDTVMSLEKLQAIPGARLCLTCRVPVSQRRTMLSGAPPVSRQGRSGRRRG